MARFYSEIFDNIYIPSSPEIAVVPWRCSIYLSSVFFDKYIDKEEVSKWNQTAYIGSKIDSNELKVLHRQFEAVSTTLEDKKLYEKVATYLAKGKVIGWVQDRMEFGPRALGNRSILAVPSIENMQTQLNLKIKFREDFRPFAPVLKAETAQQYFQLPQNSNYMEFVVKLQENLRTALPHNFSQLTPKDKLNVPRSEFQAVIHTDYSARPQTITKDSNTKLYQLLDAVEQKTGHPILVNTSFNVRGEPIVCTALDAYACFMQTDMDVLVIGNEVFFKEEQSEKFANQFKNRTFSKD
ncbi:MAG: hypothetical protein M9887_03730 [Chitinophagales bacterium]|nr:hypothetical protein [Chitinophagales bacterium]